MNPKEASFQVQITEDMLSSFRQMTDDVNPLHTNPEYARRAGFTDRVVYGMLTASFYSTLVGVYLPGKRALLHSIDVRFNKPVYVGDSLTIQGKIESVHTELNQIQIKAQIINQNDLKVSQALIKVGIRES